MKVLTETAILVCTHELGIVGIVPSQDLVTISERKALVQPDPEERPIAGCPNAGLGIKPCTGTLAVQTGYSALVQIDGKPLCLDTVTGLTDGTPPGTVRYRVRSPGQDLVDLEG